MNQNHAFLKGGGAMGELFRTKDWSTTSLGNLENWTESLKSAVSLCLNSSFSIAIYWGKDFSLLYNDTWSLIPGDKHPWSLGKPGKEVWPEIWNGLDAQFNDVLNNGEMIKSPDTLLYMHRFGYLEECYFDYSLSPITASDGSVGGVFNAVIETTYRVINERRKKLSNSLLKHLNFSFNFNQSIEKCKEILETGQQDLPFYYLYIFKEDGSPHELISSNGVSEELMTGENWPIEDVIKSGEPVYIDNITPYFKDNISIYNGQICKEALIVPLQKGNAAIKGYLLAGLSSRKRIDEAYRDFIQTIGFHIGSTINNAHAIEKADKISLKLIESEHRFKSMMDQVPVGMCIVRGDDMIISNINPEMLKFMGKGREVLGAGLLSVVPELIGHPLTEIMRGVYKNGETYFANDAPVNLNIYGELKTSFFDLSYTPLIEDGIITGILQVATDVTEKVLIKQAIDEKNIAIERALKDFQFLANSVPSVVWTSDAEGKLDYINERWTQTTGRSLESALGESWVDALHPDDVENAGIVWRNSMKTGDPYEIEFRLADNSGKYSWYLVRALPLRDDDGTIIKWYGSNTDVQDKKELEKQKDNFLGIASHELKTPITSIKAYVQVMEMMFKKSGDEKNAILVSKMDRQVNRLNHLIGDLLDVTKINNGRLQFELATFDFNEMIEEITEDVQRTSSKHLIVKKLQFKRYITGDRDRISQVVMNLLTNAIKYSPEANQIIIYTEDNDTDVKLCVQDFGIGISSDKKDKVFEQFYRVSGTKEHSFPGLGLGLYISSEIVKRLGGKIWVNSLEGKGSTFCFSLPVLQFNN